MASITSQGIGSGLDIEGLVQQLLAAERRPAEIRIATQEAKVQSKLSAYGSLKSALSAFNDELEKMKDLDAMQVRKFSTSDGDIVTAVVNANAVQANYEIDVLQLAQVQRLESGSFADSDTVVGTGTLTLAIGADSFSVEIDSDNNTLSGIRDAINLSVDNTGVSATIVNADSGSYLILTGARTGSANTMTVTQTGGDGGLSVLEYDPPNALNSLTQTDAALDAQVEIDGLLVSSDTNTVADAIDGVTLNLLSADPGTIVDLKVQNNLSAVRAQVDSFINRYNALVDSFDSLTSYDTDSGRAGPLLGDTTIRSVRDQLRRELNESVTDINASFNSLYDIGIQTDVEGKLEIDMEKLDAVLETEFNKLGQLFANSDGYAVRLTAVLDRYLDDTDGFIKTRVDGLEITIEDFGVQREQLDRRMATIEARLQRQFNALDLLVGKLSTTSNFLTQQLAALPKIDILRRN